MKLGKDEKKRAFDKYLKKLISYAGTNLKKNQYEKVLEALSAYCSIQYKINQVYTDSKVEDMLLQLSKDVIHTPEEYQSDDNTVLFYDGFGLDLRGWAAVYVRALVKNGYHLVYVTDKRQKESIPHIIREMSGANTEICFIDMSSCYLKWAYELNDCFVKYNPKFAFFYTYPKDVSGTIVFDAYNNKVIRLQIDLTDHAFWVGIKALDYIQESRIPGMSNAIYERGIKKEQILNCDCCLYINRDVCEDPLPFDIKNEKYIFSGGALYKTFGDGELLFYKVIDEVLSLNSDIKYLYAGYGDSSQLEILAEKYPERVFHIGERPDFYKLIENCEFMWNTYPMFGGVMMRMAASAGKIPLTLKHGRDHEGLLANQSNLGIEFDTYNEVIDEANRILSDQSYRLSREEKLKNSILSEETFARNVRMMIEEQKTEFDVGDIPSVDTREFRKTYLTRIDNHKAIISACIVTKLNRHLLLVFPELIINRIINKLLNKR